MNFAVKKIKISEKLKKKKVGHKFESSDIKYTFNFDNWSPKRINFVNHSK